MLIGKNIKLRGVKDSDIPKMAEWRNSPDIYSSFYEYEPISDISQRRWLEKHLNDPTEKLFIISTLDGKPIGTVGFTHIDLRNRKTESGRFLIGEKDYQNKGYGPKASILSLEYAFEHMNLNKVYLEVLSSNNKAIKLYKKLGYTAEGLRRQHIYKGGKYLDVTIMALLRKTYLAKNYPAMKIRQRILGGK